MFCDAAIVRCVVCDDIKVVMCSQTAVLWLGDDVTVLCDVTMLCDDVTIFYDISVLQIIMITMLWCCV